MTSWHITAPKPPSESEHLDAWVALWNNATKQERARFVEDIGIAALVKAIPPSWWVEIRCRAEAGDPRGIALLNERARQRQEQP